MKIAFVVFARNKAPYIASTLRGTLGQTYAPMDIYLSDQGSTDGTAEMMTAAARSYNGPNRVHVLHCPERDRTGMAGLVDHVNWLHGQIDADYWIASAADDVPYRDRTKRTVETMETLDRLPAVFLTAQHYAKDAELPMTCGRTAYEGDTGWKHPLECWEHYLGGSCSNSWEQAFFEEAGPLTPFHLLDVYLPFCAGLKQRLYYLDEELHCYVERPDPANTGLQAHLERGGEQDRARWQEVLYFQLYSNLERIRERVEETDHPDRSMIKMNIYNALLAQGDVWMRAREALALQGLAPLDMGFRKSGSAPAFTATGD